MALPDAWLEAPPSNLDVTMVPGTTFQRRLQMLTPDPAGTIPVVIDGVTIMHKAVDLTGITGIAQVRDPQRDPQGEPLLECTVTIESPATDGWVKIYAAPTETAKLPQPVNDVDWSARWDLRLTSGSDLVRPVRGRVRVLDDLSEDA
jgi:hypothetical protein